MDLEGLDLEGATIEFGTADGATVTLEGAKITDEVPKEKEKPAEQ